MPAEPTHFIGHWEKDLGATLCRRGDGYITCDPRDVTCRRCRRLIVWWWLRRSLGHPGPWAPKLKGGV